MTKGSECGGYGARVVWCVVCGVWCVVCGVLFVCRVVARHSGKVYV